MSVCTQGCTVKTCSGGVCCGNTRLAGGGVGTKSSAVLYQTEIAWIAGESGEQPVSDQQNSEAEAAETLEHAQLRAQLEEATLPLMLDAMWAANVLDIESTLQHVCKKV